MYACICRGVKFARTAFLKFKWHLKLLVIINFQPYPLFQVPVIN